MAAERVALPGPVPTPACFRKPRKSCAIAFSPPIAKVYLLLEICGILEIRNLCFYKVLEPDSKRL